MDAARSRTVRSNSLSMSCVAPFLRTYSLRFDRNATAVSGIPIYPSAGRGRFRVRGTAELSSVWARWRSHAEQVSLQLGVVVVFGPDIERDGGDFVDDGDGVAVLGEVDGFEIGLAGIAGIDTGGGKFSAGVDGQLVLVLLAASGAHHATILPLGGTERAHEPALGAVAFGAQDAGHRACVAERAGGASGGGMNAGARRQIFGVRLHQNARIEASG